MFDFKLKEKACVSLKADGTIRRWNLSTSQCRQVLQLVEPGTLSAGCSYFASSVLIGDQEIIGNVFCEPKTGKLKYDPIRVWKLMDMRSLGQ